MAVSTVVSAAGEAAPRVRQLGAQLVSREYWRTPRLVRALTALCLLAVLGSAFASYSVLGGARDNADTIGHQAAPQAFRAADLYFALSDMDAQAANLLLLGADPGQAALRAQTLKTYEDRRNQADGDLQQAAAASAGDPAGQQAVQAVLDSLGKYEALIARAELLEDQAHAPAGQPPADALDAYRQATDLLRTDLLKHAADVTKSNDDAVERTYAGEHGDLGTGWWWLLLTGLLALGALAVLQATLTWRYRRMVNVPLAIATLVVLIAMVSGLTLGSQASQRLDTAKRDAYDSVIALSRARAVAYDMNAGESRYLTDPARATAYEQQYLDSAKSLVQLGDSTVASYTQDVQQVTAQHQRDTHAVPFDGLLGKELKNVTFPGEQQAADSLLQAFQKYQADDQHLRDLRNQGRLKDAVVFDTGTQAGQSNADFDQLSQGFEQVIGINQKALEASVGEIDGSLGTGSLVAGAAALVAALALIALGVRPRLREYR